jgi:predicted nuclease with TOPRIM domain
MNNKINYLSLYLVAIVVNIHAGEVTLQEQIDEIKEQIQQEESVQEQLSTDLDAKDAEVAELREKLEELENKTVIGD